MVKQKGKNEMTVYSAGTVPVMESSSSFYIE